MKTRQIMNHRLLFALALGLAASLTLAEQSKAALVMTVDDSTASVGGGGTFNITLSNTANDPIDISGYSIVLSVASDSGITFAGVDEATPNYIFAGVGRLLLPDPDPVSGTTGFLVAAFPTGVNTVPLGAGVTAGLIRVNYAVAAGAASGVVQIQITKGPGSTEITGAGAQPLDFDIVGGAITVLGDPQVIPEPSSIIALATAAALLPIPSLVRRTRRKAG